jgi:acetylornithine/N-succinyldiaminopimelate aminotransferase
LELLVSDTAAALSSFDKIQALEQKYLLSTYARIPILLERGEGVYVFDSEGRRYLDFIAGIGVNALGYAHPRIVKTMAEQSARLIHASNLYYTEYQGPLAQRLAQLSGMDCAFFTNSGTEAVEAALKLARAHATGKNPGKFEIVALENSFHGRTLGALSITGQPKYRAPFEPLVPGVKFVAPGDAAALSAAVNENTAAVAIETIQGEGGIFEADPAYLTLARRLTDENDAALIFDEIQCGLGRTGKPFAYQWTSVVPDILVAAKPIAVGYPLGCMLARGSVAAAFHAGLHGTTFGGGPLACRLALEFLDIVEQEHLLDRVRERGTQLREGLAALAARHAIIRTIRGRGLMLGVDLDRPSRPVVDKARELGLLVNATHDTVVRMLPPYIIGAREVESALDILDRALSAS